MMFTRHHEQELAEIKALNQQLSQRVTVAIEQIKRLQKAHGIKPAPPMVDEHRAEPLLAFVHIPKTAGGTVTSMLRAAYSKQELGRTGNYVRSPERTMRKISSGLQKVGRVSAGHTPYGLLREQLPPDTRYMTFLREPVDRVLSHYYRHVHIRNPRRARRGSRRASEGWRARTTSIEEALVEMRLPQLNNLATRFLCGHPSAFEDLPASALEDAKVSLREFAFVGIQERFEESLVLLQRMLGLGLIPYRDRHVSSDRPAVDEIPEEQRALIEEYNELDAELYRFGLGLLEDAIAAADGRFAADVEALRVQGKSAREEEWRQASLADG